VIEAMLQAERLLLHGMVDQAERIYQGAFERDARNAIAVVGLARVALERGDDRLAYERARQALEIDPQNAAALRLEARLSEVLATRGEGVERPTIVATVPPRRSNSMAEARELDERRAADRPPVNEASEEQPHASPAGQRLPAAAQPARRAGLFRRLLGRQKGE
jgi:tetratricopeptide (TPR) repeat protein